jgi:hypothetical protein
VTAKPNRYTAIIEYIFLASYVEGATEVEFERDDIVAAADKLGVALPKNLGDVVYSHRYRARLPASIEARAPKGLQWVIEGAGRAKYRFKATVLAQIEPTPGLEESKVPDSTPGIIDMYALTDEQALLAKLRYNRLVDVFLGLTCYSLQNHLRTTVPNVGQVETDEVYIGLDKRGAHYVIPVQAKGGSDKLSTVQIAQDFRLCEHKFPQAICLPIAAQFMDENLIALFSFEERDGEPAVRDECHYRLSWGGDFREPDDVSYRGRLFS